MGYEGSITRFLYSIRRKKGLGMSPAVLQAQALSEQSRHTSHLAFLRDGVPP